MNEQPAELRRAGAECAAIVADITSPGAAAEHCSKDVGLLGRLDILINNAATSSVEALLDVTEREWDKVFAVNVKALFFLLQAAARVMKDSGGGKNCQCILAGHPNDADKLYFLCDFESGG